MSKFLKFIVHLVVICTIICAAALALPTFWGIRTVIMDDPAKETNLPLGSVTYAIPVATAEIPVGSRILVEEDSRTYRYNIISLDIENGTGIVADPTVSGAETLTVAVKNYVPKVVITIGYLGYLMMATKSMEGLMILGLAVLFLIILYVIAELWRKDPADREEEELTEDTVYVKSAKELKREEKERAKRMKEEDRQLLKKEKAQKKNKKTIRTGGFVDQINEDDLEPENTVPERASDTVQMATSEAHELLKKEIAAATAEEEEITVKPVNMAAKRKKESRPEKRQDVEYKKMAIPRWSAQELSEKAAKDGDAPEVLQDVITQVTLFDYSDIIADEEE